MQLILTAPLVIKHMVSGKTFEFLPVAMESDEGSFRVIPMTGHRMLPIRAQDVDTVQAYMQRNKTTALSEDGDVAYMLQRSPASLIECSVEEVAAQA